jgi:hypothetical protein
MPDPQTPTPAPDEALRQQVAQMLDAGVPEAEIGKAIQTHVPTLREASGALIDDVAVHKQDYLRTGVEMLPLAGAAAGGMLVPELPNVGAGIGAGAGRVAADKIEEWTGLGPPRSATDELKRGTVDAAGTAVGGKVIGAIPGAPKMAARIAGKGLTKFSGMGGAMALAGGLATGNPGRASIGAGVLMGRPFLQELGNTLEAYGNREADVAFANKVWGDLKTLAPGEDPKQYLKAVASQAKTPGQEKVVEMMRDAPKAPWNLDKASNTWEDALGRSDMKVPPSHPAMSPEAYAKERAAAVRFRSQVNPKAYTSVADAPEAAMAEPRMYEGVVNPDVVESPTPEGGLHIDPTSVKAPPAGTIRLAQGAPSNDAAAARQLGHIRDWYAKKPASLSPEALRDWFASAPVEARGIIGTPPKDLTPENATKVLKDIQSMMDTALAKGGQEP